MIQRAEPRTALTQLALSIESERTTIPKGTSASITATLTNTGDVTVTLVTPGDGSDAGWRTPIVGWSILSSDGSSDGSSEGKQSKHPPYPDLTPARCGNIDPFSTVEIFELAPGESRRIQDWVDVPPLDRPGSYRLVFYYHNDPEADFVGLPFDDSPVGALSQLRRTTPCILRSNEIALTVVE